MASNNNRPQRTPLIVFELSVAFFVCYAGFRGLGWLFPEGAVGHPRGTPIDGKWQIPWSLAAIHCMAIAVLAIVPRLPLVGVASYLAISFFFQVQSPEWIYTRAIRLQFIIAMLTIAGTLVGSDSVSERFQALSKSKKRVLFAFVGFVIWNGICCLVAASRPEGFHPTLQYHPVHLVEALGLFAVVSLTQTRNRSFLVIAWAVAITLLVRVLVNGLIFRDAGIARDISMAFPLVAFFCVSKRHLLLRLAALLLCGAGFWCLIEVENRGAFIGLAFAAVAFAFTGKRLLRSICIGIPTVIIGIYAVMQTRIGERFQQALAQPDLWESNKRLITWRGGLEMTADHWLFGVGPGNFVHWIGNYAPEVTNHSAHNLFVDVAAEGGVPGLTLFLVLLLFVTVQYWNNRSDGCEESRWVIVGVAAWIGCGMMLTTTMLALPYLLMAIPLCRSALDGDERSGKLDS